MLTGSRWPSSLFLARRRRAVHTSRGFPPAQHEAEADLFCRQSVMPGHDQDAVERTRVGVVGCGGLGSWIGLGLVRLGVRHLTLFDGDEFDRTNGPRQLMFPADLRRPKAHALAKNLIPHMTNAGEIISVATPYNESFRQDETRFDVLVVGVDNNRARLAASRLGLEQAIPVVFAMLSQDGLRARAFLQRPGLACLSCVLPDLDPESQAPCAAASIASCFLATAHALELVVMALSEISTVQTWRETSLDGTTERAGRPERRPACAACG